MFNFQMITALLLLILGFFLIAWSADILITGSASLARRLGVSALTIGLTIIALGTSLPEIVISITSALRGNPTLAIGNAIGSNIANIGLVLGITALITPLQMRSLTLRKELPLLFLVMLLVGTLMIDSRLTRVEGIILMSGALVVVLWLIAQGIRRHRKKGILEAEYKKEIPEYPGRVNIVKAISQMAIGFIMLPFSSEIIVHSATYIARQFNISELVIGLTIIAMGTSLPELATSIAGARKKEFDIVIGNIIGSNIFNLLAVLAIPVIIKPTSFSHLLLYRDFSFMLGISILLYIFSFGLRGREKTTRYEGAFLIGVYIAYLICIFLFK